MELKVGDKVRIKSYETLFEKSRKPIDIMSCFLPLSYAGKVVTVKDIKDGLLRIDLFTAGFYWEDYLFEKVEHSKDENEKEDILHEALVKNIASIISKHNLSVKIEEKDGGIFVKPIEKEEDLPIDTFVMVQYNTSDWQLRKYTGHFKTIDINGKPDDTEEYPWDYIIPFDKFNPNDIKESIKYNIVKEL